MQHFHTLEGRTLFAGGAIDTTYGTSGSYNAVFKVQPHETAIVQRVLADSGGRDYVVAITNTGVSATTQELQITRLTQAGAVDPLFHSGGRLLFPINDATTGSFYSQQRFDVAVDSSDRLVVMINNTVYRYVDSGELDLSFGKKGTATLPGLSYGRQMAFDASNNIYIVGTQATTGTTSFPTNGAVEKLASTGAVDTKFGKNGIAVIPLYKPANATSAYGVGSNIRVLASGEVQAVAAAGYQGSEGGINYQWTGAESIRLTAAGVADTAYGTQHGIATFFARSGDVSFQTSQPIGIRTSGQVVLHYSGGTDDPNGAGGFDRNQQIAADGKSSAAVTLAATGSSPLGEPGTYPAIVDFIGQSDGSELYVDHQGSLGKIIGNTSDTTFNNGAAITGANAAAAALQFDGTIVTAHNGSARNLVTLTRLYRDDAPVAVVSAKRLTVARTLKFSVIYRGPTAVRTASITGLELRLVDSDGQYVRPRLISTTTLDDGSVLATYKTTNIAGKSFSSADNGKYALRILGGFVQDEGGTFVSKRTLGNLTVAIA